MPRPTDRPLGQKQLAGALAVVPAVAANVTTTHTWIFQIVVVNKTAGAITFTLTDRNTVPLDLLTAVSLPANSILIADFPEGMYMPNGVTWSASAGTSLNGSITGYYI